MLSINKIRPIRKMDSLFITASSYEERCLKVPELIDGTLSEDSIIFLYNDVADDPIGNANHNYIYKILKKRSINEPNVLSCDFTDPYSLVVEFCKWAEGRRLEEWDISIDISCFTKLHLLLLLKHIGSEDKRGVIRVFYTQPMVYLPMIPGKRRLSYDIGERCFIPYLSSSVRDGREALIIFLGMEGLRANRVWEETDPEKTILIMGRPGFTEEMEKISERENKFLLSRVLYDPSFSQRDCSTLNPWEVVYALKEAAEGVDTLYIAPCGTQLQTLGIYFFSQIVKGKRIIIAYFPPKKYARPYSEGIRNTFSIYWQGSSSSFKWPSFNLGVKEEIKRDELYEEVLFNRY
ncbi:TPA: hypothetical protein DCX15_05770 [bacterium]|nr:hypothetical protein [bacterium]